MVGSDAYLHISIGNDLVTPNLAGIVSGAATNGDFFKNDGGRTCTCCVGVNTATLAVTDSFFNSYRLT